MMKKLHIVLGLSLCSFTATWAQNTPSGSTTPESDAPAMPITLQVGKVPFRGDSITHIVFPTLQKYPPLKFKSERERRRYNRLVANVKLTLPLAKAARLMVLETYEYLNTLPSEKARQQHLQAVEEGLKKQYMPTLKRLTRTQGRLLVKLIDRECNQTGYHIAQAFIGSFKANAYQALAFCFGQSLTKRYDPEGDDQFTERVVQMVESGQL